jgi:hypothetical protein
MHQLQAAKAKPATQAAARRNAQPMTAQASVHERWMELQRGIGNQAVSRVLQRRAGAVDPPRAPSRTQSSAGATGAAIPPQISLRRASAIQPKLTINTPGDSFEREADRVSERIVAMPEPPARPTPVAGAHAHALQMKPDAPSVASLPQTPSIVHEVLRSPGRPLDARTRAFMEPRFGRDFGGVRVHVDSRAVDSARAIGARAYTAGHDVVFGAGQYQPRTLQGNRLLAHELAHVQQQMAGSVTRNQVQRQPAKDDWIGVEFFHDPRFTFWAKRNGKRAKTAGEAADLFEQYRKVEETKEQLEAYDEAQLKSDRAELDRRREAALAAEEGGEEAKIESARAERARGADQRWKQLYVGMSRAWIDRGQKNETYESRQQAKSDVAHQFPLQTALAQQRWNSPEQRWVYIFQYYLEYAAYHGSTIDDEFLTVAAAQQEQLYLETTARQGEEAELARYRKGGGRRAERSALIRKFAATQPMNPLEEFETGIHDYAPYPAQPQSVNVDVASGDFDADNVMIVYSDKRELDIPHDNRIFFSKPLDPKTVLRIFTRKHKKSGRLIPFVIYQTIAGVPDLDILSEEDLALLGIPRFDPELTPAVMYFVSSEFKSQKLTRATLTIAALYASSPGLRQLGVPLAAGTLRTGGAILSGAARTGGALAVGAARQVSFAVSAYGYSPVAATYLGRAAFTYYLANAVEITTTGLTVIEIGINIGGGDTGGISPGDEVSMVVAEAKAASKAAKEWKVIEGEVEDVNLVTKQAFVRVKKVGAISEQTAKTEYDLGKKLALLRQPLGKGKAKLKPDPRPVLDIAALNKAQQKLETDLPKLAGKYNPTALNKLANLKPEQIKDAQIHPSDLEKLYRKLNSAGDTTKEFINNFHDAPNFEQVVLNWAKSQVWNAQKQEWEATKAMQRGTSFLMKYCVSKLQGKKVRFEWPQGIKDTSWGDEVWARYVDVVIEDGSQVKPGTTVYAELKSWTELTLRRKASSPYGLQYQLTRDTALFGPDRILWVFDGTKVTKQQVVSEFLRVIKGDKYLVGKWGKDEKAISDALDRAIEVFKTQ